MRRVPWLPGAIIGAGCVLLGCGAALAGAQRPALDPSAIRDSSLTSGAAAGTVGAAFPDSLASALRRGLSSWIAVWRSVIPDFDLNRLILSRVTDCLPTWQDRYDPLTAPDTLERRYWYAYSPDRARFVDPDAYVELWSDDGGWHLARDADSRVDLCDLTRDTCSTLLFCGTTCVFDRAVWLDEARFVVVGRSVPESEPYRVWPELNFFDPDARKVWSYEGPGVTGAQADSLDDAMEIDLLRRLPGFKED